MSAFIVRMFNTFGFWTVVQELGQTVRTVETALIDGVRTAATVRVDVWTAQVLEVTVLYYTSATECAGKASAHAWGWGWRRWWG